jgi:hypothetical protein
VKVQIVYLSSADDFDSTRDMLGWIQAPRVLLVWPDQGRVLTSRYELVRIHRYAQSRNIQIGLLTFDTEVRGNAEELDLPTFDSLDDLPESYWKRDYPPKLITSEETLARRIAPAPRPFSERLPKWAENIGKRRLRFPGVFILGAILITAFVLVPSAEIILSPRRENRQQSIIVTLGLDNTPTNEEFFLPIERVESEISGSASLSAGGWTNVPTEHASGVVVFTNHSQDPISIPSNTRLRSSDPQTVNFRTLNSVLLPGGVGATVGAPIEAVIPGEIGNVVALSISAIEGPLGLVVSVFNQSALTGGVDDLQPMVTASDLESLDGELSAGLIKNTQTEISSQIGENQAIVENGVWISDIIEQTFNHDIGEVGELLELSMRVKTVALTYRRDDLEELIIGDISLMLPEEKELITNSLEYDIQTQVPISNDDKWKLRIRVDYQVYGSIDSQKLGGMILGRPTVSARQFLFEAIPELEESSVSVSPYWIPILPLWRDRIVFRLDLE